MDWIEVHNARVMVGDGNARAAAYAAEHGLPGVAVSDAHSVLEVGVAYTALDGDAGTPAGLMAALPTTELVTGRASTTTCASSRRWPRSSSGCAAIAARSPRETRRERPDTGPSTDGGRAAVGRSVRPDGSHRSRPRNPCCPRPLADDDPPVRPDQLSIRRRLLQPRTILSIAVPLVIIAIFFWLNGDRLVEVPALLLQADWRYVLLAFGIFYLGFPLRGYRWKLLLRGTGVDVSTRDSTEIIFLSWLVNCIVPAKLGDVYRAYLLRRSSIATSR